MKRIILALTLLALACASPLDPTHMKASDTKPYIPLKPIRGAP